MRVLAVGDPLLDGLVPPGAHMVLVTEWGVLVENMPLQAIGRGGGHGEDAVAARGRQAIRAVEHEEAALGVALVRVEDHLARRGVVEDNVRLLVLLVRQAQTTQRLLPVEAVGRLGVAQHLARIERIARQRLDIPQLKLLVLRVVDSPRRAGVGVGRVLPRQVAHFEDAALRAVGRGDAALDTVKVVEDEVIQDELFFGPNVDKGNLVIRRDIGVNRLQRPAASQHILGFTLQVQRFGDALGFRDRHRVSFSPRLGPVGGPDAGARVGGAGVP